MVSRDFQSADVALRQAYAEADYLLRKRLSCIGCVLAIVLVPLFWGLDWVVYPDQVLSFAIARLICDVGVAVNWVLLLTTFGRRWIRLLGITWALCPAVVITWMISVTDGSESVYYAGLNLVMIIVSLLMPWTALEVATLCALTVTMYGIGCFVHEGGKISLSKNLISNASFIVATATICITAGLFASRRRFEDFRLRHELSQRNKQLAEMDKMKSEFYGNVSHELRTPLTLILAPLNRLIDKGAMGREANEMLEIMRINALRLLRLINEMLDIVRMDRGHLELRRIRMNLDTWIPGIVRSMSHFAEAKRLTISLLPPERLTAVTADMLMMEKVLLNLLSNAVKFTPEGGQIEVSWGIREQSAWIAIRDTGIGIADKELPQLFSRFHQADTSPTRRYRGLGIGLSLSRDLVERHAGKLYATSALGQGSVFTVELPTKPDSDATVSTVEAPDTESMDVIVQTYREADRSGYAVDTEIDRQMFGKVMESERANPNADLILVADDEPDMRRFLVGLLRESYRVVAVADGAAAVEAACRLKPDLVILDMSMPNLDGIQACRRIRSDEKACECRIMLLTARADDETKLSALQGGADDFMSKPFSSEEVLSRVHNLLENAAMQRSLRERNRDLEEAMLRLRKAEASLLQSEKMNALGSLAAGLLHEINNPLNYTQVAIHLARERVPDDDTSLAEMLLDAQNGIARIGSVISSLRSFAYPEQSDISQPFIIDEAVDLALRFTAHQCQGATIRRRVESGLQACGSVNQLSMVLVNLVSNAGRALRSSGEIVIIAEKRENRARIEVIDNGVGMDEERARRAFDPFYTTSEPGQGMGLGLTICHTIVRNHHGQIGISSHPGVGTTVWIELPTPNMTMIKESAHG